MGDANESRLDFPIGEKTLGLVVNFKRRPAQGIIDHLDVGPLDSPPEAQTEGWSVPKLREAINETWEFNEKVRAERIARTETIRSSNAGATEAMRLTGIEMIEWYTADDERVCPFCREMHGKRIEIGRSYWDEGQQMTVYDAEGNAQDLKIIWAVGYPPLHPNCRCTVLAVIEEV